MGIKKRLDRVVQEKYPHLTRRHIQDVIAQGLVSVSGRVACKPGLMIADDALVDVQQSEPRYVSRAGYKLEKAVEYFHIPVSGAVALDAGISTGGFTDCLLQQGAARVYGIDVGSADQVHEKIRTDARVIIKERTNLKELTSLPELVDLVTLDLSFISVLKVMDAVTPLLKVGGHLIVLIKPQFEAGKDDVGGGGIVRNSAVHQRVIKTVIAGVEKHGFISCGVIDSPIEGATGNKEFLACFKKVSY